MGTLSVLTSHKICTPSPSTWSLGANMLFNPPTPQLPWESFEDAKRALREKIHYVRNHPKFSKDKPYLNHIGGNDYSLKEGCDSVWIGVDEYVIYIRRNEKAVSAEIINMDDASKLISTDSAVPSAVLVPVDSAVGYWQRKEQGK